MLRSSPARRIFSVALPFLALAAVVPGCSSTSNLGRSDSPKIHASAPSLGEFPLSDTLWGGPILRNETITSLHFEDDHLFVTTAAGTLWAVSKDGLPRWTTLALPEPIAYPPASNGRVVAVVSKGDLYCFDRNGGALRLKRRLPFATSARPALSTTTGYFPGWDENRVHAVDLTTGSIGWFYRPRGPVSAAPTVAGAPPREVLYVASEDGVIAAYEAASALGPPGVEAWATSANGANRAAIATSADDALLLVASEDSFLYGIDRTSGLKRWAFGAGVALGRTPWAVPGAVYVDTGREFVSLNSGDGSVRWRLGGSYRFLVRNGGRSYVLSGADRILVLDDASGEVLGSFDMSAYAFFATNTRGDTLYVATRDGRIFALGKKLL